MKLARAQRMLAVADILIAQGVDAQVPASSYTVHCVSSSYFCKQTIQTRCKELTSEVEQKYTEDAACGSPVYFRENFGIPGKTYKLWGLQ